MFELVEDYPCEPGWVAYHMIGVSGFFETCVATHYFYNSTLFIRYMARRGWFNLKYHAHSKKDEHHYYIDFGFNDMYTPRGIQKQKDRMFILVIKKEFEELIIGDILQDVLENTIWK